MIHAAKMIVGWLLWRLAMVLPARLWLYHDSPLFWSLSWAGYYAYHPHDMPGWQAVPSDGRGGV
jgi:hypothetical protein